jgi:hypothetical protein
MKAPVGRPRAGIARMERRPCAHGPLFFAPFFSIGGVRCVVDFGAQEAEDFRQDMSGREDT